MDFEIICTCCVICLLLSHWSVLFLFNFWPSLARYCSPYEMTWPNEKSSENNKHTRLKQVSVLARMWHCDQFDINIFRKSFMYRHWNVSHYLRCLFPLVSVSNYRLSSYFGTRWGENVKENCLGLLVFHRTFFGCQSNRCKKPIYFLTSWWRPKQN